MEISSSPTLSRHIHNTLSHHWLKWRLRFSTTFWIFSAKRFPRCGGFNVRCSSCVYKQNKNWAISEENRSFSSSLWPRPRPDFRLDLANREREKGGGNCFNGRTIKNLASWVREKRGEGLVMKRRTLGFYEEGRDEGSIIRRIPEFPRGIFLQAGVYYSIFRGFHDLLREGRDDASRLAEQNEHLCNGVYSNLRAESVASVQAHRCPTEWKRFYPACL